MLTKFRNFIRLIIIRIQYLILTKIYGMNIHHSSLISLKARLDKTNPKGVYIGKNSVITTGVVILTHNYVMGNNTFLDTKVGDNVFLGVNSIIMPGITIGNNSIIGAGAVVTKNVEDFSIIVGNPGRLLRKDKSIGKHGQFIKKSN
jgi:acetyltransferase-like isoleucine patch superfamily enzyme